MRVSSFNCFNFINEIDNPESHSILTIPSFVCRNGNVTSNNSGLFFLCFISRMCVRQYSRAGCADFFLSFLLSLSLPLLLTESELSFRRRRECFGVSDSSRDFLLSLFFLLRLLFISSFK